jgi:hypothetical protein
MKKTGLDFQEDGYDVEYLHCSSDNDSLDGILIPALGTAMIDGTAPHVVDPAYPGAFDEIINFGQYWKGDSIKAHKSDIMKTTREIGEFFSEGYNYLKAAASIYEGSKKICRKALKEDELKAAVMSLSERIFEEEDGLERTGKPRQRNLFASAITPDGLKNYLDTLLVTSRVYEIVSGIGAGEELLLEEIRKQAVNKGLYTEAFYCALNPSKLEHLIIPEIDTALTTSNRYHSSSAVKCMMVDMLDFLDEKVLEGYRDRLSTDSECFNLMLDTAVGRISKAKALHDRLEECYVPYMVFEAIEKMRKHLVQEIRSV